MRLTDITWPQAKAYFAEHDTVLFGIGSVESHGRHLPLGTDLLIPDHLIGQIENELGLLIAPTLPYGACDSLKEFSGTVNLGADLLYLLVKQVTDELYRHGARKFIVLNGHGGNIKTLDRIGQELWRKGAVLAELNWWLMAWDMDAAWKGGHGGGEETAAICGINPALVDETEIEANADFIHIAPELETSGFSGVMFRGVQINIPRPVTAVNANGWIGPDHPRTASEAWGKAMLSRSADYIKAFCRYFQKLDIGELHKNAAAE